MASTIKAKSKVEDSKFVNQDMVAKIEKIENQMADSKSW